MPELRVMVLIDTEQLLSWAARHRDLGHEDVAIVLTLVASHYARVDFRTDPPCPRYPRSNATELRKWANWHADRAPAGVAHVLYEAAAAAAATAPEVQETEQGCQAAATPRGEALRQTPTNRKCHE